MSALLLGRREAYQGLPPLIPSSVDVLPVYLAEVRPV